MPPGIAAELGASDATGKRCAALHGGGLDCFQSTDGRPRWTSELADINAVSAQLLRFASA